MDRTRRLALRLLVGFAIVWIFLLLYPLRTGFFRAAILVVFAAIVASLTVSLWHFRVWRCLPAAIPALLAIFFLLPGRLVDPAALRAAYVSELQSYKGTRYYWGGENWLGVDCSGLLRAALVDAHFREAVRTLNPALARQGLWFWWHDAAARDLGSGAHDTLTSRLGPDVRLQDVPPDLPLPGDLAVTSDGSHVLAYLGASRWIEADPYTLRVIELVPGSESNWWGIQVTPCRWRCLEPPAP
jgi:hypothetical protein